MSTCSLETNYNLEVSSLVTILQCLPAATRLRIIDNGSSDPVVLTLSTKEFQIHAGISYTHSFVNVALIRKLLECMQSIQKVSLKNVQLTLESADKHVILNESVKEFVMSVSKVNVTSLTGMLQCIPAVIKVSLQYCQMSSSDRASLLAQSFQHTPTLQHLDLCSNSIGSDGASALAQSFQHIQALQYLDLSGNRIGSDGASAPAQSFQHIPALQHLDLSGNRIGSDGASALEQSSQHISALQHLNLSGNSIGSDGASALALEHLNLNDNSIGSDGASALAQSFQHTQVRFMYF